MVLSASWGPLVYLLEYLTGFSLPGLGASMATSRTGTAQYKQWRRRVLAAARDSGVIQCPHCRVVLDYDRGLRPNSAEPDHILPHRWGGQNALENGRVLCRRCNQSRGDGVRPRIRPRRQSRVDFDW